MSSFDPSILGNKRGIVVEGKNDRIAIESFLTAGEQQKLWGNWKTDWIIKDVGGADHVIEATKKHPERVWGVIDRDWRSDQEIKNVQNGTYNLLILPRVMIENYCIAPNEINIMIPKEKWVPSIAQQIDAARERWVRNGALWQTLYNEGAFKFCRGHETGYPMALLHDPVETEEAIRQHFNNWTRQLEPDAIISRYRHILEQFSTLPDNNYQHHIHGKNFFNQVVVQVLTKHFPKEQKKSDAWFEILINKIKICPSDFQDVLKKLFEP